MKVAILAAVGPAIIALRASSMYQNDRRFHNLLVTTPWQTGTLCNGSTF